MTILQKDILSRAIGTVIKAVGANPVLPLLSNILFESNNGSSRVAATNMEIGISYTFPSQGEEFQTCIPAKVIASLVDAIPFDEVELVSNPQDQSITVMTEGSTSNIRCAPPDDFPDIPVVEEPTFSLPVEQFKQMIQRVAFASRVGDAGSPLEGVQISYNGSKLAMFAVDGRHLSYEETELQESIETPNLPMLIKGTTLEAISRILPEEGELQVQVEQNKVMFHCGSVNVISQLLSGDFPSHEQLKASILPPTTTLIVQTKEFLKAVRQLRVFASETGFSKLEVSGMLARYSSVRQDRGDTDVTFVAICKGNPITIYINVNLLYEFLEVCKTEFVVMELAGPNSPAVFKMKGFDNFYHLIMPLVAP